MIQAALASPRKPRSSRTSLTGSLPLKRAAFGHIFRKVMHAYALCSGEGLELSFFHPYKKLPPDGAVSLAAEGIEQLLVL